MSFKTIAKAIEMHADSLNKSDADDQAVIYLYSREKQNIKDI
jgi:hypothetical protein